MSLENIQTNIVGSLTRKNSGIPSKTKRIVR